MSHQTEQDFFPLSFSKLELQLGLLWSFLFVFGYMVLIRMVINGVVDL